MTRLTEVVTEDGSITFRNEDVDECYHTKSGAMDEALRKHLLPSGILDDIENKTEVVIADVCFGLGYNAIVAMTEIWSKNPNVKITVHAFENDPVILNKIDVVSFEDKHKNSKELILAMIKDGKYCTDKFCGILHLGDVRETIKDVEDNVFNAIFFDSFSPKKVPELWTEELFTQIFRCSAKGSALTTYSCARVVRDNLRAAGFGVFDGPIIGRRSPSTIARKI